MMLHALSLSDLLACRPIHFEGSLFKGKAVLWTKGVPSQPKHLFKGQRRKSSITIQGQFKRPVVMSHFVTGPEFTRPFVNLPAKWFVEGVLLRVNSQMFCCRSTQAVISITSTIFMLQSHLSLGAPKVLPSVSKGKHLSHDGHLSSQFSAILHERGHVALCSSG